MRWAWLLLVCGMCLPGCNVAYYAAHNMVNEPKLEISEYEFRLKMRKIAKQEWQNLRQATPGCPTSAAYADGFVDGYTDYLVDGGPVRVPTVVPPQYRRHLRSFSAPGQDHQRNY
jgi:hypothetical protein